MRAGTVVLVLGVLAGASVGAAEPRNLDPDTEVARRRFDQGARYYVQGDYQRALVEFNAAREVKPLPAFDYNIARCHDRLQDYAEAVVAYERFVQRANPQRDRAEIEESRERMRILRERIQAHVGASPAAPVAPAPVVQAEPAPAAAVPLVAAAPVAAERPLARRPWFWVALVGAAAVVAAAVAVGVVYGAQPSDPVPSLGHMTFALGWR
jgi:tetratricopeptide (TPR) repeat protein